MCELCVCVHAHVCLEQGCLGGQDGAVTIWAVCGGGRAGSAGVQEDRRGTVGASCSQLLGSPLGTLETWAPSLLGSWLET